MKLFYFEWRKFVFRKYVFVFFLLLSLLDIFKIVLDNYQGKIDILSIESVENREAYEEIYNKVKGNITKEKIQFIKQERKRLGEIYDKKLGNDIEGEKSYSGNLYEDYRIFRQYIYEDFERCVQYKEYSNKLEKLAKENAAFYMKMNNVAGREENEYIAKTYNNRKIDVYYRTESFGKYFSYTFSSILMLIMCFLGVAPMYVSEKEIHMWNVINTTCMGYKNLGNVKIFASMIYASAIVFWFRVLDYLTYCFLFNMEGAENPIWAVKEFEKSPLNCSIGNYILYDIGMKTLAVCVIALVILLLSLCVKKIIHVAIGFVILLGIWLLMANGMSSLKWWINGLGMCSPLMLMDCSRLFSEFVHIEIGEHFIHGVVLAKILAVASLLLEVHCLKNIQRKKLAVCRKFYLNIINVRRIRT